ncbi:MAG TPA: HIT domain-containing protein [Acidobacteriota bacterium]|nr:HIT domain-containing protein [Acidobacteriota bacterium]
MVERLYAPWREEFILGPKSDECIFCDPDSRPHVRELILHRGRHNFIVLNRYPYNSGHLMIVPYRHIAQLDCLKTAERNEMFALVTLSSVILHEQMNPDGINVGMNIGRAAGAGIADHLHVHIVPRWAGDTNFMPALFETRVTSVDLGKLCRQLRAAFRKKAKA